MKNKKTLLCFTILSIIVITFIVIMFGYNVYFNRNPKINVSVELKNITKNDYYSCIDQIDKLTSNKIKKLIVMVNIINTPKCKVRKINIPELNVFDNIDYFRSFKMSYKEDNNLNDNYAKITRSILFDFSNFTLHDLKKYYSNSKITIEIITKSNKKFHYRYNIGDLIKVDR